MPVPYQRLLIALALTVLSCGPLAAQQAVLLRELGMSVPSEPRFGGLSGIAVAPGGMSALVVSDRGTLFDLALIRSGDGVLLGINTAVAITGPGGTFLVEAQRDSEGLARLPDGSVMISFEGSANARVAIHSRNGAEIRRLPAIPGANILPNNGAFEGVAADAQGNAYTIAEEQPGSGPIPLLRHAGGAWQVFGSIPRDGRWRPVGLDFDDRGRLYVLQRRLGGAFATRITRYTMTSGGPANGQRLLETPTGLHGNIEGISVWRDGQGRLIATMVSDDNFRTVFQSTLVEYILPE